MTEREETRHLTSEQIQEFLDRGLTPREEAMVQAHLSVCPHCQEELDGWGLLFSDLGSLEELVPGPDFSEGVISQLPEKQSLPSRVRGWFGAAGASGSSEVHLPADRIQEYLEGGLSDRGASEVREHLAACGPCAGEARGWEYLFGALAALGHLAPAPGFAERVMARVRIPSLAPALRATAGSRILSWARGLLPQTRRGWAVAGGVASAPTITVAALLYLVFSHPLLTVGTFTTYLSWKASAVLVTVFSTVAGAAVDSVTLFRAYTVLGSLTEYPFLVGFGGLAFSLASAVALWVLYRNLVTTQAPERGYARARV